MYRDINIFGKQISLSKLQMRPSRKSSIRSKTDFSREKTSLSFRVLLKSKNGIKDIEPESRSVSIKNQMNQTGQSFGPSDIRSYVKTMKNRTPAQSTLSQRRVLTQHSFENQEDILSQRSLSLSKISAKSHVEILKQKKDHLQTEFMREKKIQQIEKKLDDLIFVKLIKTKNAKGNSSIEIQQIDRKILQIVEYLQNSHDQSLDITNKKIRLIEKVIAESAIESQIAKKYFYGRKTLRKTKNDKFHKFQINPHQLKKKAQDWMQKTVPVSMDLQSTSQRNFKAPDKKYYVVKEPKLNYQFRNQPIQRSTYSKDYLVYGALPKFHYKGSSSNLMPGNTVGNRHTLYQTDFTNKTVQKINVKELDCYRDKFKNLKICYLPETTKSNQMAVYVQDKNPKQLYQQKSRHKTEQSHYIPHLLTESQLNFTGSNSKIISEIKHKNLYNLKHSYKKAVYA